MEIPINEDIKETLRRIEDHLADMERMATKDRQGTQDLNIRLKAVEAQLEEQRKAINQNAEKVKTKVQGVVDEIIESTDRLSGTIDKNKKVFIKDPRSWWDKLLGKDVIKK